MSIGISVQYGLDMSSEEIMRRIRSHGFDNVIMMTGDEYASSGATKEELIEAARRAGLYVEELHMPFDKPNGLWLDDQNGEAMMSEYVRILKDCAQLSVPCVILHTSSGDDPPPPNELGLSRMLHLLEIAERGNLDIAIENLRTVRHLDFLFERIDSPRLKFCYDSGHEFYRDYPNDTIERYKSRLICLHLHDNDGQADLHQIPGEGKIDWPLTMNRLKDAGFRGSVTLEVGMEQSPAGEPGDYDAFLAFAAKRARALEDMMK